MVANCISDSRDKSLERFLRKKILLIQNYDDTDDCGLGRSDIDDVLYRVDSILTFRTIERAVESVIARFDHDVEVRHTSEHMPTLRPRAEGGPVTITS